MRHRISSSTVRSQRFCSSPSYAHVPKELRKAGEEPSEGSLKDEERRLSDFLQTETHAFNILLIFRHYQLANTADSHSRPVVCPAFPTPLLFLLLTLNPLLTHFIHPSTPTCPPAPFLPRGQGLCLWHRTRLLPKAGSGAHGEAQLPKTSRTDQISDCIQNLS